MNRKDIIARIAGIINKNPAKFYNDWRLITEVFLFAKSHCSNTELLMLIVEALEALRVTYTPYQFVCLGDWIGDIRNKPNLSAYSASDDAIDADIA